MRDIWRVALIVGAFTAVMSGALWIGLNFLAVVG
jgi:hypothetical protein